MPDVEIVLVDPHRADEPAFFPGEVNLLRADVVVLTKLDTATPAQISTVRRFVGQVNPRATLVDTAMPPAVDYPDRIHGKQVLVIEDGPTVTHGGMGFGAGYLVVQRGQASRRVDPRPYAVGSINRTFSRYPHLGPVLPAMGYGAEQVHELEETISRVECDLVVITTPVDLRRLIRIMQWKTAGLRLLPGYCRA